MAVFQGYLIGSILFLFAGFAFIVDASQAKNKVYFTGALLLTVGALFYIIIAKYIELVEWF